MKLKPFLKASFGCMQRVTRKGLLLAVASLCVASVASGATIGLKLGVNGNGGLQPADANALLPGDLAGAPGFEQTNWVVMGRWGSVTGVWDSSGVTNAGITVNWDATGQYRQSTEVQPSPDGNLMNRYLDSNGNAAQALANTVYGNNVNNKPLVYVSGLAAWLAAQGATHYDVVIYVDGDVAASRTSEYWITEASGPTSGLTFGSDLTTHAFVCDRANFVSSATFTQVPLTSSRGAEAWSGYFLGNYVVFDSMTADSFLLRGEELLTAGGTRRAPLNAMQIVPRTAPPNPATVTLLADAKVYAGGTARFSPLVGGRAPLSYRWLKNGAPLSDGGNVSGATTATLTLTGVGAADVASYSLVVTNPIGVVTSASAALSLVTPAAGSYAEKIKASSPYAYWRLNDTGDPATNAPVLDYFGGFNGTYGAGAMNGYTPVAGLLPPAYPTFESGNTAMQSANSTFGSWATLPPLNLYTNTVTLTAWVYPTAANAAYTGLVFARNAVGGNSSGLSYGGTADRLGYNWNNQTYSFASDLIVPTNQWSLVAVAVSPTNAILYCYNTNAVFTATNPVVHTNAAFDGLTLIGQDADNPNRAFSGMIDEVAVFNRTLSPAEIGDLYKKALGVTAIPTVVYQQPLPLALLEGRPAKFNVVATGEGTLTYRWRKNNGNLSDNGTVSGAETPALTLSAVTMADAGDYDVVVTGTGGATTSVKAHLSVVTSNAVVSAYEAAIRRANPIAYWRMDETGGITNAYDYWGGNIAAHSSESIAIGSDGPQSPAFAGMETTNRAASYDGFTSATTTKVSLLNDRAQFSVIGWFNTPSQLQQLRAGLFGQNDVCEFGFHGGSSSTPPTLQTQTVGVWTPRAGAYVSVTNIAADQWYLIAAVGNGTSVNLYLVSTNNGGSIFQATGTHTASTNYGRSVFPFRIGGGGILDDTQNFYTGKIDEVAVFDRALTSDELAGLLGTALVGGELPPVISIQPPATNTLYAGITAQISVTAVGRNLRYQWRKDGVPLSDAGNISGTKTNVLTFTNLAAANAGNYDLVITNSVGSITSSNSTLVVIQPIPGSFEAAIIAAQPLAYYRLSEVAEDPSSGAVVAYDYWGGRNGTYGAAVQNGYSQIAGPLPPDWKFEATNTAVLTTVSTANSFVTAPFGTLGTNTVTFVMWLYPIGTQETRAGLLMSRGGTTGGGLGYNQDMLGYTWNANSSATYNFASGLVIPTNQWSFAAMVIAPTQATLYLGNTNGFNSAVNAIAHTSDVFGTWQIGHDNQDSSATRTFNGVIDEVAVWTRSLSRSEIEGLFMAAGGTVPSTLSIQKAGDQVVLSWPSGTLLQADEVIGPWSTNNVTSPFTNAPADARKFYRVIQK